MARIALHFDVCFAKNYSKSERFYGASVEDPTHYFTPDRASVEDSETVSVRDFSHNSKLAILDAIKVFLDSKLAFKTCF